LIQSKESLQQLRIEAMLVFFHDSDGFTMRMGGPVTPVAGQGIICVRDTDDARLERDILSPDSIGISCPVEVFVVAQDNRGDEWFQVQAFDQFGAQDRMLLYHDVFGLCKAARLVDDEFVDGDLANIMDPGSKFE
jgi:hypothetical protein